MTSAFRSIRVLQQASYSTSLFIPSSSFASSSSTLSPVFSSSLSSSSSRSSQPLLSRRLFSNKTTSGEKSAKVSEDDLSGNPFAAHNNKGEGGKGKTVGDVFMHGEKVDTGSLLGEMPKVKYIATAAVQTNGTTKRFYKEAGVQKVDNGWALILDKRLVKSGRGNVTIVPTRALAEAIALEWDAQKNFILPFQMPLMTLATTAIDQVEDPVERVKMMTTIKAILTTDSACHHVDSPPALVKLQKKHWTPCLDWLARDYQCEFAQTDGIEDVPHSQFATDRLLACITSLNSWDFAAFDAIATLSKSVAVAFAVLKRQMTMDQAFEACRVEENFQMRKWGQVTGPFGHGTDVQHCRLKVNAVLVYLNLLQDHSSSSLSARDHLRMAGQKLLKRKAVVPEEKTINV